jgi:hypothetical protein
MGAREAEWAATNLTVGEEGEKEASKGFAVAVTGYGKAGTRARAISARGRPPTEC